MDRLSPIHASPAGARTPNLLVYGTMPQPTEPPSQGFFFYTCFLISIGMKYLRQPCRLEKSHIVHPRRGLPTEAELSARAPRPRGRAWWGWQTLTEGAPRVGILQFYTQTWQIKVGLHLLPFSRNYLE